MDRNNEHMAAKPLIPTQVMSEFGDLTESAAYHDPTVMDRDLSYVPGFSEMRRRHALEFAEAKAGKRDWKDVFALPVNLRWARAQNKAGQPDNEKPFHHAMRGYKNVNAKEHKGKDWLKDLPPGCETLADGTIRRGDTILMYCDREQAARNELAKRVATEERLKGQESAFLQALKEVQGVERPGIAIPDEAAPTVERIERGEPIFGKKGK